MHPDTPHIHTHLHTHIVTNPLQYWCHCIM